MENNNHLKKQILISGVVLVIFALLGVASIMLLKKEERASFEYVPIVASSGTDQQKGFVMADKSSVSIYGVDGKEIFTQNVKSSLDIQRYDTNSINDAYKVSPDGRYVAILESDTVEDEYYSGGSYGNIITIIDLASQKSSQLVKTVDKDIIVSFSWDVSSDAIGFMTSKKMVYSDSIFDMFTRSSGRPKIYFNRVGLTNKSTYFSIVPDSEGYWDSFRLISVDGTKYYSVTGGMMLTIDKDKVEADTVVDNGNVSRVFISRDYKKFAAVGYSNITIYDLYGGEKRVLPFGDSGSSVQIYALSFSPDGNGIVFDKAESINTYSSSKYYDGPSDSTFVEDVWYYNLEDQSYKLIKTQQGAGTNYDYSSSASPSLNFSSDGSSVMYSNSYDIAKSKPFLDTKVSIIPIDLSLPASEVVIKQSKGYIIDWR